jgi:hypothetical protein
MNEKNPVTMIAGIFLSIFGTILTWLSQNVALLTWGCGIVSLVAGIYGIRVARATLRLRKRQIEDAEAGRSPGTLAIAMFLIVICLTACGSVPNAFDSRFYQIMTNQVPHVIVRTNTVVVTNLVPVVEARVIQLTNEVGTITLQTNVFNVTNATVTFQTNVFSVTNLIDKAELQPKAEVDSILRETGQTIGGLFGAGGIGAALLSLLYQGYASMRNRRINAALLQSVETAREIKKDTPQGQEIEARYLAWLKDNQRGAQIITTVGKLVDTFVDNEAAREAAKLIAGPQQPTQPTS